MTCPFCGAEVGNATLCPQCGANIADSMVALPLGTKLFGGKYTVGKVLGQGSFGITYLGLDNVHFRSVVIKELFLEGCQRIGTTVQPIRIILSDFSFMKQRFLEEAKLLASLNHPNIFKIYDYFEENNTAYMVMEFIEGKNLLDLLAERGGLMEEREAIGYIEQVAGALEAMHQAGYLHRDIKPESIMVTRDGRAVLVNFDAARQFIPQETKSMDIILTPGYAPLEQYAPRARFGPPLDIYALGATLYHLLTGQVPVDAVARVTGVDLVPPHQLNPKVSRHVSDAVMKAMAIRVDERPQTVRAFIEILRGDVG